MKESGSVSEEQARLVRVERHEQGYVAEIVLDRPEALNSCLLYTSRCV